MPPDAAFTDLLTRARGGDPAAMAEIARTYEADLRIAARVHLGPALRPYLDSLDLVQSVHRSLMLGLRHDRFDVTNPNALIALAMTMVRRKVARQWRRHRRQVRATGGPCDPLATLHDLAVGPAAAVAARDAVARVWRELDVDDRRLLELRMQGWTTAEAAEQLGTTAEALRVRLHRLRKRLDDGRVLSDWL